MTVNTDNPVIATHLHIYPTYIVTQQERLLTSRGRTAKQINNERNLRNNRHSGELSDKAQSRIKNAVNWMVAAAKWKRVYDKATRKHYFFKINLITLTLPTTDHKISDHYFKSVLLKKFINNCRYNYGLANYVWKVEAQANGNIHAHFTTDTFIHWKHIRRTWNKILAKEGLIDTFEAKHGHRDPNSTDVKAVKKMKNLAAYLCKYFSKNEKDRRRIKGRIWMCSHALSHRNALKVETDPHDQKGYLKSLMNKKIVHKVLKSLPNALGHCRRVGELFLIKPGQWRNLISGALRQVYEDHLFKIRNAIRPFFDYSRYNDLYDIQEMAINPYENSQSSTTVHPVTVDNPQYSQLNLQL